MEDIETSPMYVKFEDDDMKVIIRRGKGILCTYHLSLHVENLGFIPVIIFRKAFAELGKTGVCSTDAMFEVPWQAAEALRLTVEIFKSRETIFEMVKETKLLEYITEKNWEKALDLLSVYALAKKIEHKEG